MAQNRMRSRANLRDHRVTARRKRPQRFTSLIGEWLEPRNLLTGTASIAGVIWNDVDGDGTRSASELGVSDVTVYLDLNDNNGLDTSEPTALTAADGSYDFQNLDAASYVVREQTPTNHHITSPQASGERLFIIQSGSPPKIVELDVTTGAQRNIFSAPAGTSTLHSGLAFDGQTLWFMADSNDTLYQLNPGTGAILASTKLATGGYGSLAALGGKIYLLNTDTRQAIFVFDPAAGAITSTLALQNGAGVGSGMQDSLGESVATNELIFGSYYRINSLDATSGIQPRSFDISSGFDVNGVTAISNEIFVNSTNKIDVYSRAGTLLRTINLTFSANESASYADLTGSNRLTLAAGQSATNVNFGDQVAVGSIRGSRWQDANGNGVRDNNEQPLPGKLMYLDVNDNGARDSGEPTAATAADGVYAFNDLAPGSYVVREVIAAGAAQTSPATVKDRLFVYSPSPSKICELNPATGAVINTLTPPPNSGNLAVAFDGTILYAISETYGSLYKLDPDTGAVSASATLPSGPYKGLAYENGLLYSYPIGSKFTVIDPVTMTVSGTLSYNSNTDVFWNIGQWSSPNRLLGLNSYSQLVQIDPASGVASVGYTVAGVASVIAVAGSGSKLYATDSNGHINVYSPTGALLQTLNVAIGIHSMTLFLGGSGAQRRTLAAGQNLAGVDFGTSETFPYNQVPSLAPIPNTLAILEDAPAQTTNLSGIAAGISETQTISITATSSNPSLIPDPLVSYASPAATGSLSFTPATNKSGSTVITVTVKDDGGTTNGGTDIITRTFSINVTPVNDAPAGTDKTISVIDHQDYTFSPSDFGFSDPLDSPGNAFQAVKIVTLPILGTLSFGGQSVSVGQLLTLSPNQLVYISAAPDFLSQTSYAAFTFQVQDNGGTANSGIDLDQFPRTLRIDLKGVSTAPSGEDRTVTTLEDAKYTFTSADFGFKDSGDSPADVFIGLTIKSLPAAGAITLAGATLNAGDFISFASLNSGALQFSPVANANGPVYAKFAFQVHDSGSTADGGSNFDSTSNTITVEVAPVNDRPAIAPQTITRNEDSVFTFTLNDFSFSDPDDAIAGGGPANSVKDILLAVPAATAGEIRLNGVLQTPDSTLTVNEDVSHLISTRQLTFKPAPNSNSQNAAAPVISFQVKDNGGTANGGVDISLTTSITLSLSSVNDPPVGTPSTVVTNEDVSYTFSEADFGFTDLADQSPTPPLPNASFASVLLVTVPAGGVLKYNTTVLSTSYEIPIAAIRAGQITYRPSNNANGDNYGGFTFKVRDTGANVLPSSNLDSTARLMTVKVTPVPDIPSAVNTTATTKEDTAYTIAIANFGFSDPTDSDVAHGGVSSIPADSLLNVLVPTSPTNGTLFDNTGLIAAYPYTVSASDISNGSVRFVPAANLNSSGITSFKIPFQVQDTGSSNNLDPVVHTLTITVTPVDDPPVGKNSSLTILENPSPAVPFGISGPAYTFVGTDFGDTSLALFDPQDSLGGGPDILTGVRITSSPSGGTLFLGSTAIFSGVVSTSQINAGQLKFLPHQYANSSLTDAPSFGFTFKVQDSGSTANGGKNEETNNHTISFTVKAINTPPEGINKLVLIKEDSILNLQPGDFGFKETHDNPSTTPQSLAAVIIVSLPFFYHDTILVDGVPLADADLPRILIVKDDAFVESVAFQPQVDSYTPFSPNWFRFKVQDDGGTADGGLDTDQSSNTFSINVSSVNDPPSFSVGADQGGTDESGPLRIAEWAAAISAGPYESSQHLQFIVQTNTNPAIFAAGPEIDEAGTLSFTPAPNVSGTAEITLQLIDDAGGNNTSDLQTFQITITKPHRLFNTRDSGPRRGLDVTGSTSVLPDGFIVAADALAVLNYINAYGSGNISANTHSGPPYCDVNGDDEVVAEDVIRIINYINAQTNQPEGESPASPAPQPSALSADLIALLAHDLTETALRRRRAV